MTASKACGYCRLYPLQGTCYTQGNESFCLLSLPQVNISSAVYWLVYLAREVCVHICHETQLILDQ